MTARRFMVPAERIEALERIARSLINELAIIRAESAAIDRHPSDSSDEAKRERAAARAWMRRVKRHAENK